MAVQSLEYVEQRLHVCMGQEPARQDRLVASVPMPISKVRMVMMSSSAVLLANSIDQANCFFRFLLIALKLDTIEGYLPAWPACYSKDCAQAVLSVGS